MQHYKTIKELIKDYKDLNYLHDRGGYLRVINQWFG